MRFTATSVTLTHMKRMRTTLGAALLLVTAASVAAAEATQGTAAPATRTIILVRHGEYTADPKNVTPGTGLSPLGVAQAKLVAARLAGMPVRFDALVASPLARADETARVIAASLPYAKIETVADIAECTPRTRRKEVLADETPEEIAACEAKLNAFFASRFVAATGAERTDIVVCHGNVIRYLITRVLNVDTEAWLEMSVGHASITHIRVDPDGRTRLISAGDLGHIPPNMQTGSAGMTGKNLSVAK